MVLISLVPALTPLYLYVSTFRSLLLLLLLFLLLLPNTGQLLNDERSATNYECDLSKESHIKWSLQIQHYTASIRMDEFGRSSDPATRHNYSVILLETAHTLNHFSLFVGNDLPRPKPIFLKDVRALPTLLRYFEAYGLL